MNKNIQKFISIGELSKKLKLVDPRNNKPMNHTLRFWESEFKEIKPKIINNRRYYSKDQIDIIKLIHFLLKTKGMTINGVKNVLKSKLNKLDDYNSYSLKAEYYKKKLSDKTKNVLKKIRSLKKYGKKNTY